MDCVATSPFPPVPARTAQALRPSLAALAVVLVASLAAPPSALAAPQPACKLRPELVRLSRPLPQVARRLTSGEALKIVALGSSSTWGEGATSRAATYPARLEAELRALYPAVPITVVNKGINGNETKDEMVRFERDVLAEKPDLLIWQIGTNTLLARHDMWPVFLDLRDGVARVRALKADVVLINPQYSPRVLERPNHPAMNDLVEVAGTELNVGVFDRFAVMKSWAEDEHMAFDAFITADGLHMNDWAYGCIAHGLATAIVQATTSAVAGH